MKKTIAVLGTLTLLTTAACGEENTYLYTLTCGDRIVYESIGRPYFSPRGASWRSRASEGFTYAQVRGEICIVTQRAL